MSQLDDLFLLAFHYYVVWYLGSVMTSCEYVTIRSSMAQQNVRGSRCINIGSSILLRCEGRQPIARNVCYGVSWIPTVDAILTHFRRITHIPNATLSLFYCVSSYAIFCNMPGTRYNLKPCNRVGGQYRVTLRYVVSGIPGCFRKIFGWTT